LAAPNVDLAVLLDLDDTLVLTAEVADLRSARRWADVYAAFGKTSLPPGTREFIHALGGRPYGIVTTSPRTYAERLLRYHKLDVPVLVAYHDASPRKPHPRTLLLAAEQLGADPAQCLHIGDRPTDDLAARAAGMHSVLMSWYERKDGYLGSWPEVLALLSIGPR
jgi:HAD superfamily hydrolase (TIGR01549 family)